MFCVYVVSVCEAIIYSTWVEHMTNRECSVYEYGWAMWGSGGWSYTQGRSAAFYTPYNYMLYFRVDVYIRIYMLHVCTYEAGSIL